MQPSPESHDTASGPKDVNVTVRSFQLACTQLFRVIFRSVNSEAFDAHLILGMKRANDSLVLWARDYEVSEGVLDRKISPSGRLYQRLIRILSRISFLPSVKKFSPVDSKDAEDNAAKLLECVAQQELEIDSDSDAAKSAAPRDSMEQSTEDLIEHVACLIDASSTIEDEFRVSAITSGAPHSKVGMILGPASEEVDDGSSSKASIAISNSFAREPKYRKHGRQPESNADNGSDETASEASLHSVTSSVCNFEWVEKHFLSSWGYYMPRYESELELQDMRSEMIKVALDKRLILAPISQEISGILDLGTGTGQWAIAAADAHVNARVIGWDISPIQPRWVPPNLEFEIADFEDDWESESETMMLYDLIHSCEIVLAVKDWDKMLTKCFEHLKPGGWLEFKFIDYTLRSNELDNDHPMTQMWEQVMRGISALGIDLSISAPGHLSEMLVGRGFTNVAEQKFICPLGNWSEDESLKEIGSWNQLILFENPSSILTGPLKAGLGWGTYRVDKFIQAFTKTKLPDQSHLRFYLRVVYGQKPVNQS